MGKYIILILPNEEFAKENFIRIKKVVEYRWKEHQILYYALYESLNYYNDNLEYNVDLLPANYIDYELLKQMNIDLETIEAFVLLRNALDKNPPITWDSNLEINFYRDFVFGYGGLRLVNKSNKNDFKDIDKQIFTKNANLSDGYTFFPYGFTYLRNNFGDINELGFRLPKDYKLLKNRDKNHKVIAVFGGSSAFCLYSIMDDSFIRKLENKLNSVYKDITFTVLNFAQPGYLVLNELMTYILYANYINPDIVISHSGFNDLLYGQASDEYLQKEYDITYNSYAEDFSKMINNLELGTKIKEAKTNPSLVIKSFYNRRKQFETIVKNNSSLFISGFQPTQYSKKRLSLKEEFFNEITNQDSLNPLFKNMQLMYSRYEYFENKQDGFDLSINFNEVFNSYGSDKTLFGDIMHQIDEGEDIIAQEYYSLIKNEILGQEGL